MGAAFSIIDNTLLDAAEHTAAILVQSFFRMIEAQNKAKVLQRELEEKKRRTHAMILNSGKISKKISCTMDQLTSVVDNCLFVERKTPFIHPTSDLAQEELERVLNFQPGYTLNIFDSKEDQSAEKLKATLVNALKSGVPLILNLDKKSNNAEEDDEVSLRNLCNPFDFPIELIEDPLSIFDRNIYGPLVGMSCRSTKYCNILNVDENASESQIKKAYHKKVREVHPDKGGDAEKFLEVQTAYKVLMGAEQCNGVDEFSPDKHFKLLLISRSLQSLSPDIANFCAPIWVSNSKNLRNDNYKVDVVLPPDVSGMSYYFAKMAFEEYASRMEDMRDMKKRISKSLDDATETVAVRKVVEERLSFKYHDLRSQLFQAARMFHSPILPDHHDMKFVEENLLEQWKALDVQRRSFQAQVKIWDDKLCALDKEDETLKTQCEKSDGDREEINAMDEICIKREGRLQVRLEKMITLEKDLEGIKDENERSKLEATIKDRKEKNEAFRKFVEDARSQIEARKKLYKQMNNDYFTRKNQIRGEREQLKRDMLQHAQSYFEQTKGYDTEMRKKKEREVNRSNIENAKLLKSQCGFDELFRAAMISRIDNVNPELCEAALDGNIEKVESLILQGFNIESSDAYGYSVLSEAACTGQEEIVRLLLRLGADPNTYGVQKCPHGEQKRTPLSRATNMLRMNTVKILLDNGAYAEPAIRLLRHDDQDYYKLLSEYPRSRSEGIIAKRKEAMQKLCSKHVKQWSLKDQRDFYQQQLSSKLILCAKAGNIDEIIRLLDEHTQREFDENPNLLLQTVTAETIKDKSGRNILAIAAWKGHYKCCERLLTEWKSESSHVPTSYQKLRQQIFKVDVNTRFRFNNADGWTPLAIAIHMNYPDICSLLRRCGANPLLGTEFHEDAFKLVRTVTVRKAVRELRANTQVRKVPMIEDQSKQRYLLLKNTKSAKTDRGLFEKMFRRQNRLEPDEEPEDEEDQQALKKAIAKDERSKRKQKSLNEQRRPSSESSFHSLQLGLGYDCFNPANFNPENLITL